MDTPEPVTLSARSFEEPDEVRTPPLGRIEIVNLVSHTLGRATFQPGWRWSEHVKPIAGTESCQFTHVGTAISGRLHVRLNDGSELEINPGDAYTIPPGHDGWVVGDEPFVGVEVSQPAESGFAKE